MKGKDPKKLGKHQIKHFARMNAEERKACIADAERQMSVVAFSQTAAGEDKRAELQARIDHLTDLNRKARK